MDNPLQDIKEEQSIVDSTKPQFVICDTPLQPIVISKKPFTQDKKMS